MELLKISSKQAAALAGLSRVIREHGKAEMQAVGAGALIRR